MATCLESLLDQNSIGSRPEVIAVDNRSTDRSADIAAGFSGVTLLEEACPGAYAARNRGLRHARGPVIALTDADCAVDRDWLRTISETLRDPEISMVIGSCRFHPDASWPLRLLAAYENAKAEALTHHYPPEFRIAYANNMAVRTSVFTSLGPFKTWKRAADTELAHRLASAQPESRMVFNAEMRVTHLEFRRAVDRIRRLKLYTQTNARIPTFREMGLERWRMALHLAEKRRSGWRRA